MTTVTVTINKEKDLPALKALFTRLGLDVKVEDSERGDLSERVIEGIKAGLKDIVEGRVNPHEEVMKSINLKLENFKSNGK
jgi:hypothetical protein